MVRIAVVLGSTRPGRRGAAVADWVLDVARAHGGAEYELLDVATFALPLLDEPMPPATGKYSHEHTKAWSAAIASFDGYVFVTPEYNHSTSGALKNAIDYLYHEWANKAAGFVGYGATGATRAVEHLRTIVGEVQVADVRAQVALTFAHDFENHSALRPSQGQDRRVAAMLDQVIAWSSALKPLRAV